MDLPGSAMDLRPLRDTRYEIDLDLLAHNVRTVRALLEEEHPPGEGPRIAAVLKGDAYGFGALETASVMLREGVDVLAVACLPEAPGLRDVLWLSEIFYGGGTVTKDISSADLVGDLRPRGCDARFGEHRDDLPALIAAEARPGDLVLVMGARDPSLTDLGQAILLALGAAGET
jgi:hypothetical protein